MAIVRSRYLTACGNHLVVPYSTQQHLRAHPDAAALIEQMAARLRLPADRGFLATEVGFGRVIGRSGCVQTAPITPDTQTLFAVRVKREKPSRVVVGVDGPEVEVMAVLAYPHREDARAYVLITCWIGQLAPREPWDRALSPDSEEARQAIEFWCSHALIYDPAVMDTPSVSSWNEIMSAAAVR